MPLKCSENRSESQNPKEEDFSDLHPKDLEELRASGISDKTIKLRGYCSADDSDEDKDQLKEAGYARNQQVPGLLIPFREWEGDKDDFELKEEIIFSQLKPHSPRTHKNDPDKIIKYESPKGSSLAIDMLHCPPDIQANEPLYVVEGIKKADAVFEATGGYVMGIVGCWGWRKKDGSVRYPLSEHLKKNREVTLILDADIGSNEQVKSAARAFYKACKDQKARPKILNLAAVAKGTEGIDDYLAAGGKFRDIPELTEEEVNTAVGVVGEITFDSIQESLEDLGLSFRMEIRGGKQEVKYLGKETGDIRDEWSDWKTFSRADVCSMAKMLQNNFRVSVGEETSKPLTIGRDKLRDMIHAFCNDNKVDCMREYVESLKIWDTKPRIDFVLQHLFGVEDTPLNRWASRYLYIGTVERMFEPENALHRAIPILQGPESIGKSDYLRKTLPPHLQIGGLSDQVDLNDNSQRQCEQLQGAIIVELAELAGMRKADIEHLKSFITRITDKIRQAYGDQVEEMIRRFILYGTTNDRQPLPNVEGGNTRFVVVECLKGCDVGKYLNGVRDQLWAEALNRYRRGETGKFPRDLMGIQKEQNEKYRSRNELIEDAVASWAEGVRKRVEKEGDKARGPHPLQEVANAAGVENHATMSVLRELGQTLRAEGFEKKKGRRNGWWLKSSL